MAREALVHEGFGVAAEDIVTPATSRRVLPARGEARGVLLVDAALRSKLDWFEECAPEEAARAVLLATEARDWTIARLREAVVALSRGAALRAPGEPRLRARRPDPDRPRPVAAFLRYAARVPWENLGKPSPLLFATLAAELGCAVDGLRPMVGDDAEFDVAGALRAGVGAGVLLRTGKYQPGDETRFDPRPTIVLDSIADLPFRLT